ncbi:protein diaphanous homolog 2 isoform X2 [Octopus bimaculoides]|uniref:FH2 domain-containing protein n=1 Tax=Octopus bimaculoides TaxID=37653 RepID=A0A0L8FGA0_OCTBM|nr:protein diaphanous homolog 2 isoform X2 [Octopus bimaculoides]|eukprot:XP_014790082.1 PREDICTED: protein diaphanous homolog 2-like isoform X2 [Octopus bimaculoides]
MLDIQDEKKKMLENQAKSSKQNVLRTPEHFIASLQDPSLKGEKRLKVLESARVSLSSNPVSWAIEFGSNGLNEILRNLTYCCDLKQERRSTYECVRCLKVFMNNQVGLLKFINHEEALTILARTIDPSDATTMLEAVRLIAAICLVTPSGHDKALEGITSCAEIRSQPRFQPIIKGLEMTDNLPMQVACIQLVNAIVSTPDDLEFRIHLRNEFIRTGLNNILEKFDKPQEFEDLKTQLHVFHTQADEDSEDFFQRYENIKIELSSIEDCYGLLMNSINNTPSSTYFLSILQHFLLIREESYVKLEYFKLIEECVSQIILHKHGMDPDFSYTKRFELDIEDLLEQISNDKVGEDNAKIEEMNNMLELELTARQEAEAKFLTLQDKMKKLETENSQMKEKINSGIGAMINKTIGGSDGNIPNSGGVPRAPPLPGSSTVPPPPPLPNMGGRVPLPPPLPGGAPRAPPLPGSIPIPPPPPGVPRAPPPPGVPRAPPPPGVPRAPFPPGFPAPGMKKDKTLPRRKKYNVDVKIKRINWTQVNMKNFHENSFWAHINEEKFANDRLIDEIRNRFSMKTQEKTTVKEKPMKKTKELKVLDIKSAQNLSILLGSVKLPYEEIKRCILQVDLENLSQHILEQLLNYLPPQDAINQLGTMKDNYNELAESEQFMVVISDIKSVNQRVSSLLFRVKYEEIINDIKPSIVAITQAFDQVRSSAKFSSIMTLILSIGNYMNTGSRNAESIGFEISYLNKLKDTKTQDGSMTLLHFIAQIIQDDYPELEKFGDDLTYIEKASKSSDEQLQKNLKAFKKNLNQLEIDLKNAANSKLQGDKFVEKLEPFLDDAKTQYDVLNTMYKQMDMKYTELANYFTFDRKKYSSEEFFHDIKEFQSSFDHALKENKQQKETLANIARAKEAKEARERERKEKLQRQKQFMDVNADEPNHGVVDNLLEALTSGSAFNMNREKREGKRRVPRPGDRPSLLSRSRRQGRCSAMVTKITDTEVLRDGLT